MNIKTILRMGMALLGILGAVLSVVMLISAIGHLEWGRVVLYAVTLGVCVELTVLSVLKGKS